MKRYAIAAAALACLTAAPAQALVAPSSWEVASEFNDGANPSGVWSYGYETVLGGPFTLYGYAMVRSVNNVIGWGQSSTNSLAVVHNVHPGIFLDNAVPPGILYPAHALDLLPGNACEYSVIRFTAPIKGRYLVSGAFYGLDDNNSGYENADVSILKNSGTAPPLFASQILMAGGPFQASFTSRAVTLKKSGKIDFVVGCGTNGNNFFDHVGLNAVIERIR